MVMAMGDTVNPNQKQIAIAQTFNFQTALKQKQQGIKDLTKKQQTEYSQIQHKQIGTKMVGTVSEEGVSNVKTPPLRAVGCFWVVKW